MSYSRRMVGLKLCVIAKANTRNRPNVQCTSVTLNLFQGPFLRPFTALLEWMLKQIQHDGELSRLLNLAGRNRQPGDHLAQLLTGGDVAETDFAELLQVEQGQALGKELAVDYALAEAGDDAESDAARELVQ